MCGVFGMMRYHGPVASDIFVGLIAIQHRAHDSCGIATFDEESGQGFLHKGMGEVPTVLDKGILSTLQGATGIGHVRWTTAGDRNVANAHPITAHFRGEPVRIAHNGEIKRDELERSFPDFEPHITTDTKFIGALIATSRQPTFAEALQEACAVLKGTYSLLLLYRDKIYLVRDTTGNRPLVLGYNKDGLIAASETTAIDALDGNHIGEVLPGEIITFSRNPFGYSSVRIREVPSDMPRKLQVCIFELFYLLSPDSIFLGRTVELMREHIGHRLFQEHPVDADIVCGVADSGLAVARGYAEASGIPEKPALLRSHYAGRMFIAPIEERPHKALIKHKRIREFIKGKRVVVVDDSIVEGITAKRITEMLRRAGAAEVHFRVGSPMIPYPCFYGVPTGITHRRLIAAECGQNAERIRCAVGVDSLGFASLAGTIRAIIDTPPFIEEYPPLSEEDFCTACFTGNYQIPHTRVE